MTFVKMVRLSYKGILQTLAEIVPASGACSAWHLSFALLEVETCVLFCFYLNRDVPVLFPYFGRR